MRMIDWLVQKDLHEWQQVMSYLQRRRALNIDHIVGESAGPRETHRRELIDYLSCGTGGYFNDTLVTNNALNRSAHTGSITRSSTATVRAGGGPPSRHHFAIVAG